MSEVRVSESSGLAAWGLRWGLAEMPPFKSKVAAQGSIMCIWVVL